MIILDRRDTRYVRRGTEARNEGERREILFPRLFLSLSTFLNSIITWIRRQPRIHGNVYPRTTNEKLHGNFVLHRLV